MIAVRSCKSSDYSGWNGWQSIVIEIEYDDVWVDKTDENSLSLETYDAMRKTTESEREAEDQIMEQVNKYTCNGGRRYCRVSTWLSEIESVESKVETEMLSVKMHLTKTTRWNQVKSEDDAAEKLVSNDAKKALAEATQLLESLSEQSSKSFLIYETLKMRKEVHQITERREVLEKPQEPSKENGKDDDELRNIAARFNRMDVTLHKISGNSTARVPSC